MIARARREQSAGRIRERAVEEQDASEGLDRAIVGDGIADVAEALDHVPLLVIAPPPRLAVRQTARQLNVAAVGKGLRDVHVVAGDRQQSAAVIEADW